MIAEEAMLSVVLERARADRASCSPTIRARDAGTGSPQRRWKGGEHPWPRPGGWYDFAKRVAAILMVAGGAAVIGWRLMRTEAGARPDPVSVATLPGERTKVVLPDGSIATLAPSSRLSYRISRERGPREVALEGEAYFDVRHDESRPFSVRTTNALIQDLGTEFVVRAYPAGSRTRVAVRSGAVAVRAKSAEREPATGLRAGQAAEVDSGGAVVALAVDTKSYWSWVDGRLVFDAAPLPEVLERLSHWYGVEFRITDSTLARQYFTGAFDAVSLPQALDILGPVVHARFEQQARLVVVTPRPGGR
jgi:transmembrane sensor